MISCVSAAWPAIPFTTLRFTVGLIVSTIVLGAQGLYGCFRRVWGLNPKPLNPKPLNPKPLNPKPYRP